MTAIRLGLSVLLLAALVLPVQAGPAFPGAGVDVLPSDFDFTIEFIANPFGIPVTPPTLVTSSGMTTFTRGAPYLPGAQHRIDTDISISHSGTAFGGFTLIDPTEATVPSNGGQLREVVPSGNPGHFPADSLMEILFEMRLDSMPTLPIFAEDALYMPSTAGVGSLPYPVGTTHTATGWIDEDVVTHSFEDDFFLRSFPMNVTVNDGNGRFVLVGFITDATHVITPEPATALLVLAAAGFALRRSRP